MPEAREELVKALTEYDHGRDVFNALRDKLLATDESTIDVESLRALIGDAKEDIQVDVDACCTGID